MGNIPHIAGIMKILSTIQIRLLVSVIAIALLLIVYFSVILGSLSIINMALPLIGWSSSDYFLRSTNVTRGSRNKRHWRTAAHCPGQLEM